MSELGHNSIAKDHLKSIIERVENREAAKAEIGDEIKDIYTEAKGNGFDVAVLREIVRIRRKDPADRQEHDTVLETYLHALGML